MTKTRFAFIARNAFQAQSMAPLCRAVAGVMICRPKLARNLKGLDVAVREWRWPWAILDGRYPVLVMHGSYPGALAHRKSKIAMIQYGYAKEPYNFGAWRAAADLILAYGPYAAQKFAVFAPVREVGHPFHKFVKDNWRAPATFVKGQRLRILYAPTWGDLSSLDHASASVIDLSVHHDVTIKLHHNTMSREPARVAFFAQHKARMADKNQSVIETILDHDVVISDNSGAIFDAILCQRPVVLIDSDPALMAGARKSDPNSLEIAQRPSIGVQAQPDNLRDAVETAGHPNYAPAIGMDMLYADVTNPMIEMKTALADLADGKITGNQMQTYSSTALRKGARQKQTLLWICAALASIGGLALLF
jgi:hypothetical protein